MTPWEAKFKELGRILPPSRIPQPVTATYAYKGPKKFRGPKGNRIVIKKEGYSCLKLSSI